MAAPHQASQRRDRADEALAHRALFRAVLAVAWRALERHGLSEADRKDIAQNVAIRAYLRRATYCADRGNVEQWLSGFVRNEVRAFLREQGKQPRLVPGDAPLDAASETPTPEESVSLSDLADHVFAFVPPDERRVVIHHAIEGRTLREIAEIEGISPSTAFDRHQRGMAALRRAAGEQKLRGMAPFPTVLAAFFGIDGDGPGPPPDLVERAWRRVAVELGLDEPPQSEPPESGTHRVDPSPARDAHHVPSTRPPDGRSPSLRRLGPIVGALLGGLIAGPALVRGGDFLRVRDARLAAPGTSTASPVAGGADPTRVAGAVEATRVAGAVEPTRVAGAEPTRVAGAVEPTRVAGAMEPTPVAGAAEPAPVASLAATATSPEASPAAASPAAVSTAAVARRTGPTTGDNDAERAIIDRGRSALALENLPSALTAFVEHARRFPRGQNAALRDRLWNEACARSRGARGRSDQADLDARCAGRPR